MNPTAKKALESLPGEVDALLIANEGRPDPNFFYVTGIGEGALDGCVALLERKGVLTVIAPKLEEELVKRQLQGKEKAALLVYGGGTKLQGVLKEAVGKNKALAFNDAFLSVRSLNSFKKMLPKNKWVAAAPFLQKSRLTKTEDEIRKIQMACLVAEKAMKNTLQQEVIVEGVTEMEVAAALDYEMKKAGASPAFPTIVAFQENAAEPHHPPTKRKLNRNELVLVDWGAKVKQYCSDITRTWVFGKPQPWQERMHEVVLEAQNAGFEAIKEGRNAAGVHERVSKVINTSEFKGKFIHGTGHSLGLEVHDGGGLGAQHFQLRKNMVFTMEPGVYVAGKGGVRIEDDVVVEKNNCRLLSALPRGLGRL